MTSLPVIHELIATSPNKQNNPFWNYQRTQEFPNDLIFKKIDEWLTSEGVHLEEPTES